MIPRRTGTLDIDLAAVVEEARAHFLEESEVRPAQEDPSAQLIIDRLRDETMADFSAYIGQLTEAGAFLRIRLLPASVVDNWTLEDTRLRVQDARKNLEFAQSVGVQGAKCPVAEAARKRAMEARIFKDAFESLEGFEAVVDAETAWAAVSDFFGSMRSLVTAKIQQLQRPGASDFLSFGSSPPSGETRSSQASSGSSTGATERFPAL